jgi:hypothetical protein
MTPTNSQASSDYFGSENSQFLEALQTVELPGDTGSASLEEEFPFPATQRRPRSSSPDSDKSLTPPPAAQPGLKRRYVSSSEESDGGRDEKTPKPSSTQSTDYFGEDDPEFFMGLEDVILPGDITRYIPAEPHNLSDFSSRESTPPPIPPPAKAGLKRRHQDRSDDEEKDIRKPPPHLTSRGEDVYGESHFGEFGEYMRRKRAKLQLQNTVMEEDDTSDGRHLKEGQGLFKGISIYVSPHPPSTINVYSTRLFRSMVGLTPMYKTYVV